MSKNKNKFVKQNGSPNSPVQILLVPVSIILSGVIIAVSFLVGSTAIISNMKSTIEASVTKAVANAGLATATPTAAPITITDDQIKSVFTADHIVFGDKSRKVTLIEFSDPNCPYCHAAAGLNPTLSESMGAQFKLASAGGTYVSPVEEVRKLVDEGKASFVWIYAKGHGTTDFGGQAMYCANEKGKFWAFHDKIMTKEGYKLLNNDDVDPNYKVTPEQIAEYSKDIVDQSFMLDCLKSGKYSNTLQRDMSVEASFGSSGTPGFFVNNTNFAGAYSYTDMEATVKSYLGS